MNLLRKLFFWKWTDDEVLTNAQQRLKLSRVFIAITAIMAVLGIIGFGLLYYIFSTLTEIVLEEPEVGDFLMPMGIVGFLLGVCAMSLFILPLSGIGMWIYQVRVSKLLLKLRDRVRELEARPAHRD